VGENVRGWPIRFHAQEVINSGATQTDPLELARDWMTLLNRGNNITPIGSSDSHDVSRFIVGQGRTYIRGDDSDPGQLDAEALVQNVLAGQVLVSYGLIAELKVNGRFQSGELAVDLDDELAVHMRVLGPQWVQPRRLQLFANGELVRDERIDVLTKRLLPVGVKWEGVWKLPKPRHDVHLVAIALGDGITSLHWPTAKPYQPTSSSGATTTLGISGAVWIDGDGDGKKSSARRYAERIATAAKGDLPSLIAALGDYDSATAAQAAYLVHTGSEEVSPDALLAAASKSPDPVRAGFAAYVKGWRETQVAGER
jgi:hypothetical protein